MAAAMLWLSARCRAVTKLARSAPPLPSRSRSDSARKKCQPTGKDHRCQAQSIAARRKAQAPGAGLQAQAGAPGRGALKTAASWRPWTATCGCPGRGPTGAGPPGRCCRARRTAAPRLAEAAWPHPGHTGCSGPWPARSYTESHLAACKDPCLPWHRSRQRPLFLQLQPRPGRAREQVRRGARVQRRSRLSGSQAAGLALLAAAPVCPCAA